jgi:isopentenyldiphosphate isomerase
MSDSEPRIEKDQIKDNLAKIKSQIEETKKSTKNRVSNSKIYDGIYLFYSFDLVNSTAFKNKYKESWTNVFKRFYDYIVKEVQTNHKNTRVWKYIGDEILLYKKINNQAELITAPSKTSKVIQTVTNNLHKMHPETKGILFVKSTLWIAKVKWQGNLEKKSSEENGSFNSDNIVFPVNPEYPLAESTEVIDFLGPDIDLGFRITKHTEKSKLLISAELAYLLYLLRGEVERKSVPNYRVEDNLKIISFEHLKGIWNGRRYPIIWYSENWDKATYDYEEQYDSEKVNRLIKGETLHIDFVSKVFDDVNLSKEISEYLDIITATKVETNITGQAFDYIPREKLSEVHCAAICFDLDGRLLIARRPEHKDKLKGKWEFGCGQLKMDQSFKECIEENYKSDFGANIVIEDEPIFVTTYIVYGKDRKIPGILFLGLILNPDEVELNFDRTKHDEVKWIEMDYLETINATECVPDFRKSARMAYENYKQYIGIYKRSKEV